MPARVDYALSQTAISLLASHSVRFRYKDYAHGARRKLMNLAPHEFLRRFCLHVLPRGFMRIRHYGLIANRNKRALLARARAALGERAVPTARPAPESVTAFWQRVAHLDITRCPRCQRGRLHLIAVLAPNAQAPPP